MSWPVTLPQTFHVEGYQESWPDNTIRQPMEVGPPKVRQRQTAKEYPIHCSHKMTTAQLGYLETFFKTTTSYGAEEFDLPHPRTGSTVSARFMQPPTFSPYGGGYWIVNYVFEILP
jgi:hypothetical protein